MSTTALPGLRSDPFNQGFKGHRLALLLVASALILAGLLALYSLKKSIPSSTYFTKQVMFIAIGAGLFLGVRRLNLEAAVRFWPWVYALNVAGLLSVYFIGDTRGGATRWIEIGPLQFQPSEFAKLFLIVTLSAFYATPGRDARDWRTFLGSLAHALPIVLMVFKQPHLGGAVSLLVIWGVISMCAGARWQHILIAISLAGTAVAFGMRGYQLERIEGLVSGDSQGSAYQVEQSLIAFATGGLTGAGFGQGPQKISRFIPAQQTDFVFTIIGEEGGLVGSTIVLVLFVTFFYLTWWNGVRAETAMGRYVSFGVLGVLAFHTVANLGMVMGLTPVVGLWLPFMSYGGTAIMTCIMALGLLSASR